MNTPTGMLRPGGSPPLQVPRDHVAERASLAATVLDCRTFVEVTIPRTTIRARLRVLTRSEAKEVRAEARRALAAQGLDECARSATPEAWREWHEELCTRSVAVAVRSLTDDTPLAPLEEWELCGDDQIESMWQRYNDLQTQLDPLAAESLLSDAEVDAMRDAAKKKDSQLLISYGSSALATFAISMVAQQSS